MPKKRFTEEQVAFALRQADAGTSVGEICRKTGVAEATFYRWRKVYAGMGVSEIRRLKQLEEVEPSERHRFEIRWRGASSSDWWPTSRSTRPCFRTCCEKRF